MKIFLKRDTSTSDSLFTVFDELCKEKYFVTRSKNTIRIADLITHLSPLTASVSQSSATATS